jgi:hypothetical protein
VRWSKLKRLVEANFAPALKGRVALHSTVYGVSSCGHAWLVLDGEIIASFCSRAHYNRFGFILAPPEGYALTEAQARRHAGQMVDYGEISQQDIYAACWAYVHDMKFDEALASDDAFIQSLAVLDRRLGKRRYAAMEAALTHALPTKLLRTRLDAEAGARKSQKA